MDKKLQDVEYDNARHNWQRWFTLSRPKALGRGRGLARRSLASQGTLAG